MDNTNKRIIQRGKRLAFFLRHDKGYQFDEHGWREISDLITNHGYSMDELKEIVATNNKQRFEFSEDMTRIRARQGHSVHVDVELEEKMPPDTLYHGTAKAFLNSIMEKGIIKGNRLYVHLSSTKETATNVGKRHGEPVVLAIDTKRMVEDGHRFFLSRNGVWLTDYVDSKYIISSLKIEDYFATERNGHQLVDNYDKRDKNLESLNNNTALKNLSYVVFSHGKKSGPLGSKIQCLMAVAEELGLKTISIDYRECASADERVILLHEHLNKLDIPLNQIVLVGSSMGGYVSMVVANEQPVAGLFLMAPALWMPAEEYTIQFYSPKTSHIEITHGMLDDTVSYENSIRFAKEHNGTILHLVTDDHRLKASHDFLAYQFQRFLEIISKTDK